MEKITGQVKIQGAEILRETKKIKNLSDFKKTIKENLGKNTTNLLDACLGGAIALDSSDIHLEPKEKDSVMRLRMDGVLHESFLFDKKTYKLLVSRIKLLSGLKLNVCDKAQDGRFTILFGEEQIETRSSSLPSEYGETVVLRILNPKNLIEVEDLGIREDAFRVFEREIREPNGMIIVTGPTGSGKTTTLYAILKRLQNPEIKIITIEDPIEYHLAGISQTQVNPKKGYDFVGGLRAIVRQDPDVILVGEIRDYETAQIALQASLTGHLVLTTLHTNDAAGTIVRLQALGEKAVNIAPAINLAVGQRLLRKICPRCGGLKKPDKEELKILKSLSRLAQSLKIPEINDDLRIPEAKNCSFCNNTGYKGRIGIFEFFLNSPEMENFILKSPSISQLKDLARKKGMITMREDGLIKVLEKKTTVSEVIRTTKQEENSY